MYSGAIILIIYSLELLLSSRVKFVVVGMELMLTQGRFPRSAATVSPLPTKTGWYSQTSRIMTQTPPS